MLAGRTIVVTGAARGLGRAIAECCGRHGARLIVADILEDEGEATRRDLEGMAYSARFVPVDLGDPSSIQAMAADIAAREGKIEGLINNAALATGLGGVGFEDIDIALWDRVMQVNVRGTWLVTRALSPLLADNSGRIVNIASDTALWGQSLLLAYVASKGAVISMTRSLARELGPRGIGVVGLAPGLMRNEATDNVPEARHRDYEQRRAVPGPQRPEDIVEVIAFAVSQGALPFTGQVIPTDAGFHYV
jgi:NAD(P)-dependent dehydrogenase (short-subunit alcohol dehydrogenase family)